MRDPSRLTRLLHLYEQITVIANDCAETEEALDRGLRAVCETTSFALGHAFLVRDDRLEASGIWSLEDPSEFDSFQRVTTGLSFPLDPPDGPLRQCVASSSPRWFRDVATERGAVRLAPYRIEATHRDSVVEVAVRDSGPGVDPDFVPRLFERFTRVTDGGTGAGIGLEIVHSLVALHGGSARYEPCEPSGAAFIVAAPQRFPETVEDERTSTGGEAG